MNLSTVRVVKRLKELTEQVEVEVKAERGDCSVFTDVVGELARAEGIPAWHVGDEADRGHPGGPEDHRWIVVAASKDDAAENRGILFDPSEWAHRRTQGVYWRKYFPVWAQPPLGSGPGFSGVVINGHDFSKTGLHRYEPGYPERYVVANTPKGWMKCEICGKEFRVWMTHDALWKRLPKRLWRSLICTGCFRRFA
jgi:hypothetical protein